MEHGAVSEGGKRLKFREREWKTNVRAKRICFAAAHFPLRLIMHSHAYCRNVSYTFSPSPPFIPPPFQAHTWTYLKLRGNSTALFG